MNLKQETKEIDGLTFTTRQFPAMRAFNLMARLAKAAGPVLMLVDANGEGLSLNAGMIQSVLGSLDPREVTALLPEVLNSTTALVPDATGGREFSLADSKNIDLVFSGRLPVLFQVIGFALQVNFQGFSIGSVPGVPALEPTGTKAGG